MAHKTETGSLIWYHSSTKAAQLRGIKEGWNATDNNLDYDKENHHTFLYFYINKVRDVFHSKITFLKSLPIAEYVDLSDGFLWYDALIKFMNLGFSACDVQAVWCFVSWVYVWDCWHQFCLGWYHKLHKKK